MRRELLLELSHKKSAGSNSLTGNAVEVVSILGDLIERGRKHGVSAPIVRAAFVSLTIYQQGRAQAKAARG